MKLVPAKVQDHERLTFITRQSKAYWNYSEAQLKEWEGDLLITPDFIQKNIVFQLIDKEEIIAYYTLIENEGKSSILLENLFILPDYIGRGLGKFLLNDAIQKAIDLEYTEMSLEADPNATDFYLKMGFKIIDQKQSSIPNRFLPIMTKQLLG